jgi:hypothetical protein
MESNESMKCPKEPEKLACKVSKVKTNLLVEEQYPKLLTFNLTWQHKDIINTNCLKILASLPPHTFLS